MNKSEEYLKNTNAMMKALDNTGVRMFMYYPQEKKITVPEQTCVAYHCKPVYENMPHSFAEDYVYEDDYGVFKEMYYKIDRGQKTATATFHSKDLNYCNHVTLTAISWAENGLPTEVIGFVEDRTDLYRTDQFAKKLQEELAEQTENEEVDEALKVIANSIGSQYFAVYYIWMDTHSYICFQERLDGVLSLIGEKGLYEPAWDQYIRNYIKKEDQDAVREFVEFSTLAERIGDKNSISINYRRKEIGWTRGQFIVGHRDENGKILTLIYTVADISEEMEFKRKREEAEEEALRDPMTHLWNRKAFDYFKNKREYKEKRVGLLLFDIDRFKGINDQYGHEVGDEVIIAVADVVSSELRKNDQVFRTGGDEFAILLYNCDENFWKIVGRKIENIHAEIKERVHKNIDVTISAGLCVNVDGYDDEMYSLADKALYNTKTNGRAGCSFADSDGTIIAEWHDKNRFLKKGDVLERNSTVTWRVDVSKDEKMPHRLYGDEMFYNFVCADLSCSPEELYRHWEERVEKDYLYIIRDATQKAITDEKADVVFLWNHPEKGSIQIRCSISLETETEEYYLLIGYAHAMTGTHIFTLEDVSNKIRSAMEELYFCSYYMRFSDYSFKIYKAQPYVAELIKGLKSGADAVKMYLAYLPDNEEKERIKQFYDVTTLKERLKDNNVEQIIYYDPSIGVARARYVAVERNEAGEAESVSLIVEQLESVEESEQETHAMADRMQQINENVIAALTESFLITCYVNIKADFYRIMMAADRVRNIFRDYVTVKQGFTVFVNHFVAPEFQTKLNDFFDMETIVQRMEGKRQINCEYISKMTGRWCRASLIATEWTSDGDVAYVLFTVSENINVDIGEAANGLLSDHNLQEVFDNVPGGVVMYEWDGRNVKVLKASRYYEETYGCENVKYRLRLHPDDEKEFQEAVKGALATTHSLEYVARVWKKQQKEYVWTKIKGVAEERPAGHAYIYGIFIDISEQKIAESRLQKSTAAIMAALGAADQFSYEYDPVSHTSICFTAENKGYEIGQIIENYPECFRDTDFIHPDDVELFINTVHKVDEKEDNVHCDIRVKRDGRYHWHSCTFDAFFDTEKERRVALLTVVDVTPKKAAIESYEKRMEMLSRANADAMCMCDINLTKNTFSHIQGNERLEEYGTRTDSLDELIHMISEAVFDREEQATYRNLFNCSSLLKLFAQGESHISLKHFYRDDPVNTQWIETVFDLMTEPATGDVVGICYAKNLNDAKMSRILLNTALENDYSMAALVYADTGEYYLYEIDRDAHCEHRQHYWERLITRFVGILDGTDHMSHKELTKACMNITKENVVAQLDANGEYAYVFYGSYHGRRCRLEAKFRYMDKEHGLVIATLRNITDTALYEKYKFDSEHDPLTGLFNRSTLFRKCEKLLEAYPDKQFAMLHCDVRRFHLYNTFFGEKEGDKLLCKIANLMTTMGNDYEHFAYGRIEADVFGVFFEYDQTIFEKHIHYFYEETSRLREDFPVEPTIGVYMVHDKGMPVEAMFTRATIAAKTHQKNMFDLITRYDAAMEQELVDTHHIISEMQFAIEQEQFEVYIQPKYSLRSKKLVGGEALVRWNHPEKGMISPGKFIPVFEQNGFIAELDRYMWEHVCQVLQRWKAEGRPMYPISVNISRVSMYNRSTVYFLKQLVKKYEIDPANLGLELTESAYMDEPEELKSMLLELQEYGFKILMDDFGSGYSSLNTLRELPVDVLKLDMRFLSRSQNDKRGAAVLASVVRMSRLLHLPIVAEGVEKEEQANYLRDIGCEYVQGFLFARPMPVEEYEKLLTKPYAVEKETSERSAENIMNLLAEQNTTVNYLNEAFPSAFAFVEYENGEMTILRFNRKFIQLFELVDDMRPVTSVIKESIDSHDYEIMTEAICEAIREEKTVTFTITRNNKQGRKKIIGCVDYKGAIDHTSYLMTNFISMPDDI